MSRRFDLDDYMDEEMQGVLCIILGMLALVIGVPVSLYYALWPLFGISVWTVVLAIWRLIVLY